MENYTFKISGKVLERDTEKGIAGLMIEALDKDLFVDDRLGSTFTDQHGAFTIGYQEEDFQELFFDKKPDIYLRIKDTKGRVVLTTKDKVRYDAGKTEVFIIHLPKGTRKELRERKQMVQVALADLDGIQTGTGNQVVLKTEDGKEVAQLAFNELTNRYEAQDIAPGNYIVEALGADKTVGNARISYTGLVDKLRVKVSLAAKDQKYFYIGEKKVYYRMPENRFGLLVENQRQKGELLKTVLNNDKLRVLKAEPEQEDKDNPDITNIGMFKVAKEISDNEFNELNKTVGKYNGVTDLLRPILIDKVRLAFLTSEIIVRFKPHITQTHIEELSREFNLVQIRKFPYASNTFKFRVKGILGYKVIEIANTLAESEDTVYAEPNIRHAMEDDLVPTDHLYDPHQWHLPHINAEDAWDVSTGDNNINICVYDRGLWIDAAGNVHPDFDSTGMGWTKVHDAWDFNDMNNTTPYHQFNNHGTLCCGVATGLQSNSGEGVTGMAPDCSLIPCRRHNNNSSDEHADAYIWAAGFDPDSPDPAFPAPPAVPADVIVSSFGSNGLALSGLMRDAFDFIATYGRGGKGCVMVFSAGNGDIDVANREWASYEKTICVAASDNNDVRSVFNAFAASNFGEEIDICAPSSGGTDDICTTAFVGEGNLAGSDTPGASLDYDDGFGGTSSAAPLAAGLAALILSVNPDLTWIQVRDILRDTAVKIDAANNDPVGRWLDVNGNPSNTSGLAPFFSNWYGYGRIDALAAVNAANALVGIAPTAGVDTWIKEKDSDTGTVPQSPPYWSPDVWVRNTDPATDNPAEVHIHQNAIRGQDNWVYARVRNRGALDSSDVYVRLFITRWAGTQYIYPDDFIPNVTPSTSPIVTMAPGTYFIGEAHIDSVPAGGEVIVNMRWASEIIPPESVVIDGVTYSWADSCLLADVSPHDGPTPTGVNSWDNNNLCQKNITIVDATDDDVNVAFVVGNLMNRARTFDLRIDRFNLPAGVELYFDYADRKLTNKAIEYFDRKKDLQRLTELTNVVPIYLEGGDDDVLQDTILRKPGILKTHYLTKPVTLNNHTVFKLPTRQTTIVKVLKEHEGFQVVALRLKGLKKLAKGDYQIDVYQQDTKGNLEGGINLLFRK